MTEYRSDGRQKVTTPGQPKPLSHVEAAAQTALDQRRAADRDRQRKHRAKVKQAKP